ncbi:MAG: M4 family metallopeptidase, partial [Pseudomonadota bacterium]
MLQALPVAAAEPFGSRAVGAVTVTRAAQDDRVRTVRAAAEGDLWPARAGDTPTARALAFLDSHAAEFGLNDAQRELKVRPPVPDAYGFTALRFTQVLGGLDVYGTGATAVFAPDGRLTAVSAGLVDTAGVGTTPRLSAAQALQRVTDAPPLAEPHLIVYAGLAADGSRQAPRLAWELEVGDGERVRDFVYVDALGGKVVDRFSGLEHALDRIVYDGGFNESHIVWQEGDDEVVGVLDIDAIVAFSRDTYNLFSSISGGQFLSWDSNGGTMHSVTNPPGFSCPNASWNGVAARFCPGYTGDDVVSHEFTHGYTDATHDLIYRWQSGALNEAYSDIFGEVVDILNGDGID